MYCLRRKAMNSAQYLDELRRQLQGLPQEEIDSCVRYYEEYLLSLIHI